MSTKPTPLGAAVKTTRSPAAPTTIKPVQGPEALAPVTPTRRPSVDVQHEGEPVEGIRPPK